MLNDYPMSSKENSTCILPRCESKKETFFQSCIYTKSSKKTKPNPKAEAFRRYSFAFMESFTDRIFKKKKAIKRLIHIALEKFLF